MLRGFETSLVTVLITIYRTPNTPKRSRDSDDTLVETPIRKSLRKRYVLLNRDIYSVFISISVFLH